MINDIECPNCGNSDSKEISIGTYNCNSCDSIFKDEKIIQNHYEQLKYDKKLSNDRIKHQSYVDATQKTSKNYTLRVFMFVGLFLVVIFGFIFFMAKNSIDHNEKMQQNILEHSKEMQQNIQSQVEKELNK